jgi:oligo-1,6-glucosidase
MLHTSPSHTPWWKSGSIYHIYPRSFRDTNADGLGDLPGITAALPYLKRLGIDAIWMGPIFASPQVDNGYDISDYYRVDPLFGTNSDLEVLLEEAHRRDIRVLLDLVFNHTSNRHRWFEASRRREPGFEDFYIWRDSDPSHPEGRPNDWTGFFSLPAWTFDEIRGQYYLHLFAAEQPDLNWENPEVRGALADVANFWIDAGVDGFRMDVINMISKAPGLPSLRGGSPSGVYIDGPQMLPWLAEFRSRLHRNDTIVLVGETPAVTTEAAAAYTLPSNRALDMVLLFDHLSLDHGPRGRWDARTLDIAELAATVDTWQRVIEAPRQPCLYMSNHDQPRIVSRYGNDGAFRFESATALAAFFFLQRGTPIIYQGDELGMANFPLSRPEEFVDIESTNALRKMVDQEGVDPDEAFLRVRTKARDNGRTPMQWSPGQNAGFTGGDAPWYPVNPDYIHWNAERQEAKCPGGTDAAENGDAFRAVHDRSTSSVFCFYRSLLALRRRLPVLTEGSWELVVPPTADPAGQSGNTVVYNRSLEAETVTVAVTLGDAPETVKLSPPPGESSVILANYPDPPCPGADGTVRLRPWEVVVYRCPRRGP